MAGQLDRLLGLSGLPNVSLKIIPQDARLPVLSMHEFFQADDVTVVEMFGTYVKVGSEYSGVYDRALELLDEYAVEGAEATRLLATAARET
jgi:hypothetical protein